MSDCLQGVFTIDEILCIVRLIIQYQINASLLQVDERIPPMVDDFLYVCDDAYS